MRITITVGGVSLPALLNDSVTAWRIWEALPLKGRANIWGDEIYFEIPVMLSQAVEARVDLAVGELAYWPVGHAFCIFFGPTPVSTNNKPRAYSPVNVFGAILGDAARFKAVKHGAPIRVERG
jgi:hypothetical protein